MMLAKSDSSDGEAMATVSKSTSVPAAESSGEPVVADVEYVLSEDLKDLSNIDTQLQVSFIFPSPVHGPSQALDATENQ